MATKKREPFVDDGRTIANMNVPGMPWHLDGPKVPSVKSDSDALETIEVTKEERRAIIKAVMMTVIPIGCIFGIAYFVIFLLMHYVWLS